MPRQGRLGNLIRALLGGVGLALFTRLRPHRWIPPMLSLRVLRRHFEAGAADRIARMAAVIPQPLPGTLVLRDLSYDPGSARDGLFDLVTPPVGARPAPLVVWTHGGAWYYGSKADPLPYLEMLAGHGYAGMSLNVPRIPEQPHPAAAHGLVRALAHLVERADHYRDEYGVDTSRIVLAGDSAGAQVAGAVALACANPAYAEALGISPPLPAGALRGAVLFAGTLDASALGDSGRMFTAILSSAMWAQTGTRDWRDSGTTRLMTLRPHLTADHPPTFLRAGRGDPLTAGGTLPFAARLEELGVPVDCAVLGDDTDAGGHNLQFEVGSPFGQQIARDLVAFLDRVTD
jgi:acetyl esterase/lipase